MITIYLSINRALFIKAFTLILLLCANFTVKASNYYFSAITGDDSRSSLQAQNESTPWKTLAKLDSIFSTLQPGDSVLFKRGESFYGSINIHKSGLQDLPIMLTAYGAGGKPIITGLSELSDWAYIGNGIWESYNPSLAATVNVLLLNGVAQEMGRYPNKNEANKGYLTYETHTGNTAITDKELPAFPNWAGAEVVVRKNRWIIDRHVVTHHADKAITYAKGNSAYTPTNNYGYFIQNHLNTLDQLGEWYYDPIEKKMKIYFGNGSPLTYQVQASSITNIININSLDNITFKNLSIQGANHYSFEINDAQNIYLSNCDILYSGKFGVKANSTENLKIEDCNILYSNTGGIDLEVNNNHAIIRNTKVDSTYIFAGMGENGDGKGIGIHGIGQSILMEYNQVLNTGYTAISFQGDNVIIKNNFIDTFCLTKDDGGGIYTLAIPSNPLFSGRQVTGNIIINGIGAGAGSNDPAYLPVMGIYLDDNASGVEVSGNTVANIANHGIFFHNAHDIVIANNTFYNNECQLTIADYGHDEVRNNTFKNNIFFSKFPDQRVTSFVSLRNNFGLMASFFNNSYCRPFDDQMTIVTDYIHNNWNNNKVDHFDLDSWKEAYQLDAGSQKSPVQFPAFIINSSSGENKFKNGTFSTGIGFPTTYSPTNNISTSWTTDNHLDGGCLEIYFPGRSLNGDQAFSLFPIGDVEASRQYLLKFSLIGSVNSKSLGVYIRSSIPPYHTISQVKYVKMGTARVENELLLSVTSSLNAADLVFEVNDHCGTFWLDNISLHEVDATLADPDNYIHFEFNASNEERIIALDGAYVDVNNNFFYNTITLAPYASIILLRYSQDAKAMKANQAITFDPLPPKKTAAAPDLLSIFPNPTNGKFTVRVPGLHIPEVSIEIINGAGKILFKKPLQRSGAASTLELNFDLSKQPSGLYLVKIISPDNVQVGKIINQP